MTDIYDLNQSIFADDMDHSYDDTDDDVYPLVLTRKVVEILEYLQLVIAICGGLFNFATMVCCICLNAFCCSYLILRSHCF
jgi:hypothetical protein